MLTMLLIVDDDPDYFASRKRSDHFHPCALQALLVLLAVGVRVRPLEPGRLVRKGLVWESVVIELVLHPSGNYSSTQINSCIIIMLIN